MTNILQENQLLEIADSVDSSEPKRTGELGFTLVEVLISLLFSSIVALGLMRSSQLAFATSHNSISRSQAMQIAMEKLEELLVVDPALLSAANNETEDLSRGSASFRRITTITVNPDRTRKIEVTVNHACPLHPINLTLTNALVLRGER